VSAKQWRYRDKVRAGMCTSIVKQQLKIVPGKLAAVRWIIALICLAPTLCVQAQPTPTLPADYDEINTDCTDLFPEDSQPKPPEFFSFFDTPQKTISSGLESMARSIDEFFANEKVLYRSSGSSLRYSIDSLFEEGGRVTTVGKLDISLHLPRTEQKLKLVLESDPVEKQTNIERATTGKATTEETGQSYYAGLQSQFGKKNKWRFKPSIGLKLHFPPEYYFRMRAFRDINFTQWTLHLTESAYWYDTTGAGFDSEMAWDYLLEKNLLFRASSLVRNTEEYKRFDLSQIFSITHTLSNRRAITYSIGFFGNSDPTIHATDYLIQARYRQIVHSNYFFMELVPQIRYRIDYGFTEEDSLLVRFEWLFQK
jgi:hypothetical protein